MSVIEDMALQNELYGTHAQRPAAGAVPDGSLYNESDTGLTFQSESGSWVVIATASPVAKLAGLAVNASDSNKPARSNLLASGIGALTDSALAATDVGCVVPVPVQVGDVITVVSFLTGATQAGTPTHQFGALYKAAATAATCTLLAQSTDGTSAAATAKTLISFTLASAVTVSATNAPNGFLYAMVGWTASAVPTAVSYATPAGVNFQWNTTGPLFQSGSAGASLAGTAPADLTGLAAKATAPVVILT